MCSNYKPLQNEDSVIAFICKTLIISVIQNVTDKGSVPFPRSIDNQQLTKPCSNSAVNSANISYLIPPKCGSRAIRRWNQPLPAKVYMECRLASRWGGQRRLSLVFIDGLSYTTIIELAEPAAGGRGTVLDRETTFGRIKTNNKQESIRTEKKTFLSCFTL